MAINKYLLCARAVGTHGVSGTLRLENHTDSPKVLAKLKTMYYKDKSGEYIPVKIEKASVQKEAVLAKLDVLSSLEEAITWKGREFYAAREDFRLRRGEWFIADVIGLPVFDAESKEMLGYVKEVMTGRIQDIYVIDDVNGGTFMVPHVSDFIKEVKVEGDDAGVYVSLIDGMRGE
ncbi:MAG: 16S rRNA processing protein RimM [Clostridia bacterium]|nr:16S rRNA processing protein RimM [Clostridia bacterium]